MVTQKFSHFHRQCMVRSVPHCAIINTLVGLKIIKEKDTL